MGQGMLANNKGDPPICQVRKGSLPSCRVPKCNPFKNQQFALQSRQELWIQKKNRKFDNTIASTIGPNKCRECLLVPYHHSKYEKLQMSFLSVKCGDLSYRYMNNASSPKIGVLRFLCTQRGGLLMIYAQYIHDHLIIYECLIRHFLSNVKIVEDVLAKLNMVSLPHSIFGCLHIHWFLVLLDFPRGSNEPYFFTF